MVGSNGKRANLTPAQMIVLAFAGAIALGTVLLALPVAHAPGHRVGLLDAFFTSTSAVCVTGLIVVDTGGAFSRFGETVIMLLIKAGGLGILTLGALLALATGRRLGFRQRQNLQVQTSGEGPGRIVPFIRILLVFTISVELMGALALYLRFRQTEGMWEGWFYALFHSVSAFNNAGFSLYADSLSAYRADPLVSLLVPCLIILGGLGMPVLFDLADRARSGERRQLLLNTKTALLVTAILLAAGWALFMAMEWRNPATLGGLEFGEKLLAGFFQAATPRTAGFNTLDFSAMHTGTLVFFMLLMFVGGNPGGTAGGIKTTTFAVLLASAWTYARGKGSLVVFNRRVTPDLTMKAGVIATIGVTLTVVALVLLTFTEPDQPFLDLMFETVSAIGTVGLSLGATAELSAPGKIIISILMFLGRVGLLTFALALVEERRTRRAQHPPEDLIIG